MTPYDTVCEVLRQKAVSWPGARFSTCEMDGGDQQVKLLVPPRFAAAVIRLARKWRLTVYSYRAVEIEVYGFRSHIIKEWKSNG